jgi:hypothetical protein
MKTLGHIVCFVLLTTFFAGCSHHPRGWGEAPLLTSIADLESYLVGQTGAQDAPLDVKLAIDLSGSPLHSAPWNAATHHNTPDYTPTGGTDFSSILSVLGGHPGLYVALDLSACEGATVFKFHDTSEVDTALEGAKAQVVSLILPDTIIEIENGLGGGRYGAPGGLPGNYATFDDYDSLRHIAGENVAHIGHNAFFKDLANGAKASPLATVSFPNAEYIGQMAFDHTLLTKVRFPKVTSVGASAFSYARLTSIEADDFPELVTTDTYAFSVNETLTSVSLPKLENMSSGSSPNGMTFAACTALETAYLPSVKFMGESVFYECTSLASVYFGAIPPSFSGGRILLRCGYAGRQTVTFYVPNVNTYTAVGLPWSDLSADAGYWYYPGYSSYKENMTVRLEQGTP